MNSRQNWLTIIGIVNKLKPGRTKAWHNRRAFIYLNGCKRNGVTKNVRIQDEKSRNSY